MIKNNALYGVILAGGKGERLWPLSREKFPKQLLELSQKSLLQHTYDRITTLIPSENSAVVTIAEQIETILKNVPSLRYSIVEPCARNTGPALLYSCLVISEKDPEAIIVFSPADHYIADVDRYTAVLQKAVDYSMRNDVITLVGVKPTYPATGYGYIEYQVLEHDVSKVIRFCEKPSQKNAEAYFELNTMLWNSGIFCAKASVFIEEYKKLAPELFEHVYAYFVTKNDEAYYNAESISVDYAIMEKSDLLYVVPADFAWSDVGNLETFLSLNLPINDQEKQISIDSKNNLVASKTLTVLIGVDDLCVVQTDDVLLIAKRADVEKVKLAVHELKKNKLEKYL
jgi:mannose-1-phosphate guanylyltransferase